MHVPLNDLSRAHARLRVAREDAVLRVLRSGWYVMGPEHAAFETEFAAAVGVAHCVGVANGTDALELALRSFDLQPGDEVVTAANAGGYASAACRLLGLRPVYADVDPLLASLTAATVEPLIGGRTRALVVTHLYGQLADVEELVELCHNRGLALVEDCAQAAGARRGSRAAGSFGDVATFSFYPTKNLGALGDGGAVVTNDADRAVQLRALRQYGWSEKYVVATAGGRNSRLDEIQAAVLRLGLAHLDEDNVRRRGIASRYRASLAEGERLIGRDDESFVAHLAVVVSTDRDALRKRLGDAGVQTAVHYPVPDHQQQVGGQRVRLPVTEDLSTRVVTVPCYPELADDEIDAVSAALGAGT